jgi:putative endonuclease
LKKVDFFYYTYILECSDGTYYIGKTTDLTKRLTAHNGKISGGAKYTRSRRPVFLKYYEKFDTLGEALKREIALKKLSRKEKSLLLNEEKH